MEVWIGRDGERHGPYTDGDIRQWLRSGQVSRDDLGWYEGLADWQPLSVLFPEEVRGTPPPAFTASSAPGALPQTTAATLEDYAGFWKRVAAYILDAIILYIPSLLIQKIMGGDAAEAAMKQAQLSAPDDPHLMLTAFSQYYDTMLPAVLIITVMTWLYFAFCESSAWQATIGKLALGIRVTDMHGARISLPRALGRYPAKYLSAFILLIGFLMVAWTQRKQGLHDMVVSTLVLNGRASEFKPTQTTPGSSNNSFTA
ncbi:RDD family protein [Rhodanobacter sp. MP1X3]|uniref:RDD family protein n=1 Tax=Rhodanobacter sp. MP1X3 TaxID=2723086 RepID=UPI001616B2B9|nr:RDD family protein [Rhodanobacter sp. MP1X3]MBB6240970.1 putative RDD family membrane protein YckC [Rhodanobacter sp. MP1X3]